MSDRSSRRFPESVYRHGVEPDPRFSLANERTFLAWVRTSLALLASGVALEALGLHLEPGFKLAASLVLIAAGIGAPVQAWFGWMITERALRMQRTLPSPALAAPIVIAVGVAAILVVCGILLA
jgi:putative membrane protein